MVKTKAGVFKIFWLLFSTLRQTPKATRHYKLCNATVMTLSGLFSETLEVSMQHNYRKHHTSVSLFELSSWWVNWSFFKIVGIPVYKFAIFVEATKWLFFVQYNFVSNLSPNIVCVKLLTIHLIQLLHSVLVLLSALHLGFGLHYKLHCLTCRAATNDYFNHWFIWLIVTYERSSSQWNVQKL